MNVRYSLAKFRLGQSSEGSFAEILLIVCLLEPAKGLSSCEEAELSNSEIWCQPIKDLTVNRSFGSSDIC